MKKLFPLVIYCVVLILSSCTTMTTNKTPGNVINETDSPDPNYAYFVITAQGKKWANTTALIFSAPDKKDNVTIEFTKTLSYQLIKVKPTSYRNDFDLYFWDVYRWAEGGSYKVSEKYSKCRFTAEKNKVYYVGYFDDDKFEIEDNYLDKFRATFPNFKELEVINPYQ